MVLKYLYPGCATLSNVVIDVLDRFSLRFGWYLLDHGLSRYSFGTALAAKLSSFGRPVSKS